MPEISPKKDIQFDLWCPTCRRYTKQALVDGIRYTCTICTEEHEIPTNNGGFIKALAQVIAEGQEIARKLGTT